MAEFVRTRDQYVVGNPDIVEEYKQALATRRPSDDSAIEIKSPVDGKKMDVIRDQLLGTDVNGDGYDDIVEGRGFRIGYGTPEKPFRWVTFTFVFFGSPERSFVANESYDLPDAPDMLCAGRQILEPAAIDWERSAVAMIDGSEDVSSCDTAVAEGVHELGHALHYHHAAATSGGSSFGGARMATPAVRETFSGMAEEMIFTKEWMNRYLSSYAGFKVPAVRLALAHEYKDMRMYWASVIVALPLWEMNLYREENPDGSARSMDERLRYWGDLGKTYFNYDDVGMDTSRVAFYSVQFEHPGKYPLQRPAYVLGMNLRDEMTGDFQNAMRTGDEDKFKSVRARLVGLFQRSAWLKTVKKAEEFYHGGRGMGID